MAIPKVFGFGLSLFAAAALHAGGGGGDGTARSVAEILRVDNHADLKIRAEFQAQVLIAMHQPTWLFLQDGEHGVFAFPPTEGVLPSPGDWVSVSGLVSRGGWDPIVTVDAIRTIERRPLPAPARLNGFLPSPARLTNVWASVSGIVSRARRAGIDDFVDISLQLTPEVELNVSVGSSLSCDPEKLVNSRVTMTGVYGVKWLRGAFYLKDCAGIEVLERAPALWDSAATPISSLFTRRSGVGFGDMVHLRGTVTMIREPDIVYIQQEWKGIQAELSASPERTLRIGETLDVVGRLSQDSRMLPYVSGAKARRRSDLPEPTIRLLSVRAGESFEPSIHGTLLEISGRVSSYRKSGGGAAFTLGKGPFAVEVSLPGADSGAAAAVGDGDEVGVKGILEMLGRPDRIAYSVRLWARSANDLRVIARRAWIERVDWGRVALWASAMAGVLLLTTGIFFRRSVIKARLTAEMDYVDQVLTRVLREVAAESNPARAPGLVLLEIAKQSGADLCYWFDYDPVDETLCASLRVRSGILVADSDADEPEILRQPFPARTSAGYRKLHGRDDLLVFRSNREAECVWPGAADWHGNHGRTTVMCLGVRFGDRPIGLIDMAFRKPPRLTALHKDLIRKLANHLALAVHLNRLYGEANRAAVLEERTRIARDIHDNLAQAFTGVLMQLKAAGSYLADEPEIANACVDRAEELARQGLRDARRSVYNLAPLEPQTGLLGLIEGTVKRAMEQTGVAWSVRSSGEARALDAIIAANMVSVCQEAIANVQHHASASKLEVGVVFHGDRVELVVSDDGAGFDVSALTGAGYGIASMKSRADRLEGALSIESAKGQGTQVKLTIPLEAKTRHD